MDFHGDPVGHIGAGGEASSLVEKKGVPPKADLSLQKTRRSGVTPVLLERSTAGAGAKGGTPPGPAGLMEQGQFGEGGGLMVR